MLSKRLLPEYIYLIEELGADRVKIGFSRNPWARLSNLRTSVAGELRMRWLFLGTRADEQHLHWVFQNHRIRGEWFQLTAVIAGFKHYGFDVTEFLSPTDLMIQKVPISWRELTPSDGELFEPNESRKKNRAHWASADYQRTFGRRRVSSKQKGGVKWSSPEYRKKLFGFDPLDKKR